jgi:HAD superfamily hydrolase (TIGR01509 family)
MCEHAIPVKPGALEMIAHLRAAGLPMAVATSTGSRSARDHLSRAGILPHLVAVVGRDDVTQGKPHPEPYLKAAAHLGVEPALCLALEDSHNGVRAAAAAGTMTVMVPDLLPATEEMRRLCVHIASDLGEVRRMLEGTIEAAGRTTRWHRG